MRRAPAGRRRFFNEAIRGISFRGLPPTQPVSCCPSVDTRRDRAAGIIDTAAILPIGTHTYTWTMRAACAAVPHPCRIVRKLRVADVTASDAVAEKQYRPRCIRSPGTYTYTATLAGRLVWRDYSSQERARPNMVRRPDRRATVHNGGGVVSSPASADVGVRDAGARKCAAQVKLVSSPEVAAAPENQPDNSTI
jgi:hypothetical protein